MIFLFSIGIIILDQITKYWAINRLKYSHPIPIIPDFFKLVYVENYGAAFGIMQNKRWIFLIITSLVIIIIIIFLIKNYNNMNFIMKLSIGMLLGGAIGNFIDRARRIYVVDFFSFRLFNFYEFPVFNIADIFIVIGTIIIVGLVLFDKYQV